MPKTMLSILMLTLSALAASACPSHEQQVMSCAEGAVYDTATHGCKPVTG